jgi:hypothetical protein
MVFFSLSLLLNVTGVSVHEVLEMRPGTVVRILGGAEGKILKYYDNWRFVYEIESRLRELKRAVPAEPAMPESEPPKPLRRTDDRTSMPRQVRPPRWFEDFGFSASAAAPVDSQAHDRRSL